VNPRDTLREVGEFGLISRIARIVGRPGERVSLGIGDDCAVVQGSAGQLLITTDMMVEGIHFRLDWYEGSQLGHKALAASLSDVAAMGGVPRYALISIALREALPVSLIEEIYRGMVALSKHFQVELVGGDTVRSPDVVVLDVVVVGEAPRHPRQRSQAREGHLLMVTGSLGGSAAGLQLLEQGTSPHDHRWTELIKRHLQPWPRVREGRELASLSGVGAMIDISDGLVRECHHLAAASEVAVEIWADHLPLHPAAAELARQWNADPLRWALFGGEEYELLVTGTPSFARQAERLLARHNVPITTIGRVLRGSGVRVRKEDGSIEPIPPVGWEHFR